MTRGAGVDGTQARDRAQFPAKPRVPCANARLIKLDNGFARLSGHVPPGGFVLKGQFKFCVQVVCILRRAEETVHAVPNQLRRLTDRCAHTWEPTGQRLNERQRKSLVLAGTDKQIGRLEEPVRLVALTNQKYVALKVILL